MIFPILTIADKLLPWKTVKTNINEKLHCDGFTYILRLFKYLYFHQNTWYAHLIFMLENLKTYYQKEKKVKYIFIVIILDKLKKVF